MKKKKLVIKVDSREQLPLEFSIGSRVDDVIREGLPYADYWCEIGGKEIPIVVERKGLGDLYGTMTSGYERFKRMMDKAKRDKIQIVLAIEGTMRQVAMGYEHSKYSGESMLKKLFMLWVKYDLVPIFCEDRASMARMIEELFDAIRRNYSTTPKVIPTPQQEPHPYKLHPPKGDKQSSGEDNRYGD